MDIRKLATALTVVAGVACHPATTRAYEAGDFLAQLLAAGFYSDASGHIAPQTNYDSGPVSANPALNLTYFFTKDISAQTVIAVPWARVDLHAAGQSQRATDQWVLPLSIIGQYHFFSDKAISPFIGAGLTYAKFWEEQSHLGSHVEVDDTYGGLINFGVNYKIPDTRWVAVFDVKKWWLAETNVHIGGNRASDVTVNPWFFGVGIGYNFATPALF